MKNFLITLLLFISSLSIHAQKFEYLLDETVAINFEKIALKNETEKNKKIITESSDSDAIPYYRIETPYYTFAIHMLIGIKAENTEKVIGEVKDYMKEFSIESDDLVFERLTNKHNQDIYFTRIEYSLEGAQDEYETAYNYYGVILPEDKNISEVYIFNLNILPTVTSHEDNNYMIAPKFTGLDMIYSLHLYPEIN